MTRHESEQKQIHTTFSPNVFFRHQPKSVSSCSVNPTVSHLRMQAKQQWTLHGQHTNGTIAGRDIYINQSLHIDTVQHGLSKEQETSIQNTI